MMIIGIILGALFIILGGVNISSQLGLESGLPSQVTLAAVGMPELIMWILLILGGFFLWIDATRKTRVFNGVISFVVGAIAIFVGLYPLLLHFNILSWSLVIPRWVIPYLAVVLGGLLIYDNISA